MEDWSEEGSRIAHMRRMEAYAHQEIEERKSKCRKVRVHLKDCRLFTEKEGYVQAWEDNYISIGHLAPDGYVTRDYTIFIDNISIIEDIYDPAITTPAGNLLQNREK
jgi:hypothetical protein